MLSAPNGKQSLEALGQRIAMDPEQSVLGPTGIGRVALLTSSARRENRIERLREFFEQHGVSGKTIAAMADVAEELVMNALYDAPVEAGYYDAAIPRTTAVELPPEHACEISYGIEGDAVFVRLRDPFGSLRRGRLLTVLERCSRKSVSLDESRGGAGLGMWRVFSHASTLVITVIPGRLTDIVVWLDAKRGRNTPKQIATVQMFFPREYILDEALGRFAADHDSDLIDDSFTAIVA
jgi:hypothetical protein